MPGSTLACGRVMYVYGRAGARTATYVTRRAAWVFRPSEGPTAKRRKKKVCSFGLKNMLVCYIVTLLVTT